MSNKNSNKKTKEPNNNIMDKNNNEIFIQINYLLQNYNFIERNEQFIKEIENIKNIIKSNLNDITFLTSFFNKLKQYIISSPLDNSLKTNTLSLITIIIEIDPIKFMIYADYVLTIYQCFLNESYSPLFPKISQHFGDLIKIQLYPLNNICYKQKNINGNIILVYNKYKSFCLNNIQSNSIFCKICGTLCLTTFIENCSFIYNINDKLKEIYNILMNQLDNKNNVGKLEILNCLTSLIFCSETQFIPFAKCTIKKIIDLCIDQEWIIKKFALNILCTLMYYCQEEVLSLKDIIMNKLNFLKEENSPEIKEIFDQINTYFLETDKIKNENKLLEMNYLKTKEIYSKVNVNKGKLKSYEKE